MRQVGQALASNAIPDDWSRFLFFSVIGYINGIYVMATSLP